MARNRPFSCQALSTIDKNLYFLMTLTFCNHHMSKCLSTRLKKIYYHQELMLYMIIPQFYKCFNSGSSKLLAIAKRGAVVYTLALFFFSEQASLHFLLFRVRLAFSFFSSSCKTPLVLIPVLPTYSNQQ